ncbi:MAG: DUF2163 domain-containing protein [Rhizobiales bacterium]|nr:DUF2163 domain-containing protein [Hyphomicrobiales bacterium]
MRIIPPTLQAKLDSGVTMLCRCWRLTRRDGVVQGFTDHDRDLDLDGVTCRAGAGLAASEATQGQGLAVAASEVFGALTDDTLNEDDLAAGLYDAAAVEVWLVDWSEPALRVLLAKGVLGEVRRGGQAFAAELRGLAHRLAEDSGRLYTATCSADLGDARCTVDLDDPAYRGEGTIVVLTGTSAFTASGLDAFGDGWFTAGRLVWTGGANAGLAIEVKHHRSDGAGVTLDLWQAMPHDIAPGDTFTVTAGCDKRFATCRDRFANGINFRGFPHIPGNDFIVAYPVPGAAGNDGGSLNL